MIKKIGLDMGCSSTRIFDKGIVLDCPTAIAIRTKTGEILAAGSDAKRMFGKTPPGILTYRPLQKGVVAEPEAASNMLKLFFDKIKAVTAMRKPVVAASVPCVINEVEKRALTDTLRDAGAGQVYLIESPLACAVGANLKTDGPGGRMVVDFGGGCVSAAVLSMGNIITSDTVRTGGADLDKAIVQYIRKRHNLLIGEAAAESLKIRIGSAWEGLNYGEAEVTGKDLGGGLTGSAAITSADICRAVREKLLLILDMIKCMLENIPPELAADIYDNGLLLAGGGSELKGLPELISEELKLRARTAKDAALCCCRGIGRCLNDERLGPFLKSRDV